MPPIITLTTDFGHLDAFVGVMKGVMLNIAPEARLVDLCHETPPQDLMFAVMRLEAALPYFPDGTVHLVVVDPDVGTERAPIAIQTRRSFLIGPDNGVLPAALDGFEQIEKAVRLTNTRYHLHPTSHTFHGRDIFAPCAAHLATGVPLEELGEEFHTYIRMPLPEPVWQGDGWQGHVVTHDRFGNLITDIRADHLEGFGSKPVDVRVGDACIHGVLTTYGDVSPHQLVAYIGSGGRLEIGVRNGSAADLLGSVSDVVVEPSEEPLSPE